MAEPKTKPTSEDVNDYLNTIANETRSEDCRQLVALFQKATGENPVLWGQSIIGFGAYRYTLASGKEAKTLKIGISSRKEHIVLYGTKLAAQSPERLTNLGKYTQGKGCLYIKKLADVNLDTLDEMIRYAYSLPSANEIPSEAV